MALSAMPGMRASLIASYIKLVKSVPWQIQDALAPDLAHVRIPPAPPAVPAGVWTGFGLASADHPIAAGRHPRILFEIDDNDPASRGWSVGMKGGGAADFESDPRYRFPEAPSGTRFPFARTLKNGHALPSTASHRIWGGMQADEAALEFTHALALHDLSLRAEPGVSAATAIPLDVVTLEQVPVQRGASTEFVDMAAYASDILGYPGLRLAELRAVTRSGLRIAQATNALLEGREPNQASQMVALIAEIYRAWGQPFQPPERRPKFDEASESETQAARLAFLREIYLLNQAAADRIVVAAERQTLRTIALAHGAGGHLGGMQAGMVERDNEILFLDPPIGAASGGATAPRNMTVSGEILDLDGSVYFPWIGRSDMDDFHRLFNAQELQSLQAADLDYWELSMYWLRQAMSGRELRPGQTLVDFPFGDPEEMGLRIIPSSFDLQAEQAFALLTRDRDERGFRSDDRAAWYWRWYAAGREARKQLGD
jgi:hypothetical protein